MKIAVIGLGVIGGSLGMALTATGRYQVTGIDRDMETVNRALEIGAVAEATCDCREGVSNIDLVFLAVPVGQIFLVAQEISRFINHQAIVTDVGSTKEKVVYELEKIFPERFVGGHPMTGSELSGLKGADQYLYENAIYALTPTEYTCEKALEKVQGVVKDTGARIILLQPKEHDRLVAAVSHLPHLLAVALMLQTAGLATDHPATLLMAAGGFRDLTRIAAGHPLMWKGIYESNRECILQTSRSFRNILEDLEKLLETGDYEQLSVLLEKAGKKRESIPFKLRGFLPARHEIVVTIPDRPGAIAHVTGILGENNLNIIDIEILRVREGEGGSIRLAFSSEQEANTACVALRSAGIKARER